MRVRRIRITLPPARESWLAGQGMKTSGGGTRGLFRCDADVESGGQLRGGRSLVEDRGQVMLAGSRRGPVKPDTGAVAAVQSGSMRRSVPDAGSPSKKSTCAGSV